jgi:hypothetical protein
LLQIHYASYMIFSLVYKNAQNYLLATPECPAMTNNILWNAVVLVQCLWFIENRERFSLKDAPLYEENISGSNHNLGFTGYGVDDFMSNEKRGISIFDWFDRIFKVDNSDEYFPNVETLSQLMNDQYNELRRKIPELTSERHQFISVKNKTRALSIVNIYIYSVISLFRRKPDTATVAGGGLLGVVFRRR